MAIVDGLVTLAQVKLEAGVSVATYDALIESLITGASARIDAYLDRKLKRTAYTGIRYAVNNHQYLYMDQWPIQSASSVTLAGAALTVDVDYWIDSAPGRLYRPGGWAGSEYVRGTFPEPFAGARDVVVSYTAGYYLPADAEYVAGAADSLPLDITSAATMIVLARFRQMMMQSDGVQQYSEGGISITWADKINSGFDGTATAMLSAYKRQAVA